MADLKYLDTLEEVLLERGFPLDIVQSVLETVQTIDAVEVVRCEGCIKRYDTDECPMCFAFYGKYYEFTEDDGFCHRGERKEE